MRTSCITVENEPSHFIFAGLIAAKLFNVRGRLISRVSRASACQSARGII